MILLYLFLIVLCLPIATVLTSGLIEFWTRSEQHVCLTQKYQRLKYGKFFKSLDYDINGYYDSDKDENLNNVLWGTYILDLVIGFFLFLLPYMIGSKLDSHFGTEVVVYYIGMFSLLGFIFLPRYGLDILKSIQYSFKHRDALRIKKMEEEIQKLKERV